MKRSHILVMALAPVLSAAAAFGGTLDQSNIPTQPRGGAAIYSDFSRAQTFTVGLTGLLDRIELQVWRPGNPTAPLNVAMRTLMPSGAPDTTAQGLLVSFEIPAAEIPTVAHTPNYIGIDFGAKSFHVDQGDQLAIVVTSNTGNSPAWYGWGFTRSPDPPYLGGGSYLRTAVAYNLDTEKYQAFRTFVSVPEPSTCALASAAFGLLVFTRRKRNASRPVAAASRVPR